MRIELGYGKTTQTVDIPNANYASTLELDKETGGAVGPSLVAKALRNPIGTPILGNIVRPGEHIAIVTSDITRPVPSRLILPLILDELKTAGVRPGDITVVFALGSHRPHTHEEMIDLVGPEVFDAVRCVDSDPGDCIHLGQTTAGTPVTITRVVAEADRRIAVGNIEYHYFAGYSGGAKAVMPGCSTRAAIQQNHRMMVHPEAVTGHIDNNPVRLDLEEAIALCPIDFIVNVVLGEHKEIRHAVAGHFIEAHRVGCRFLDSLYRIIIPERADIVIASQGGAPKDINLYQTQKALDNAKHAVKPGGIIILAGACGEGLGERVFEDWMMASHSPADLIERIGRDFQLGGHKAAAIAMVLREAHVYLVSDMDPDFVRRIYMEPFAHVQQALDAALQRLGSRATVLAMPYAGATLPSCEG